MEAREKTTTDCFAEKFSETKPKTDLLYLKTMPSVIICGLTLFASSLILMALSFSEITSVAIAFAICSALLLFTNLVMIPFLVKIGISFNKFDRKLFMLKKKKSLSELSASANKEGN